MVDVAAYVKTLAHEVDALMDVLLAVPDAAAPESRLFEAMHYSALAGGKRIRPVLVMAAYEACGGKDRARALRVGAAIEMVHTYTLMQDDLPCMDNDDLRRGKPTAHKQFDECTAVLASDGLQADAYKLVMADETHPDLAVRAAVLGALLDAAGSGGVLAGQMIDMVYEWNHVPATVAELKRLQSLKTGALIEASCVCGGLLAGAGPDKIGALKDYATALGLVFQITDDMLDVTEDAATLGKTAGKDEAAGKATFVTRLGLEGARAEAQAEATKAVESLAVFQTGADVLEGLVGLILDRKS